MPDGVEAPRSEPLRAMYWRSEILQVMYWLLGEGLGDIVDAPLIERFLGVDATVGVHYLDRLVDEGYLDHWPEGYALSPLGLEEGGSEFGLSFAELTRPSHGECSASCWCHLSVDEADACTAERSGHQHN